MSKPNLKALSMAGAAAVLVAASLAFIQQKGVLFPDWSAPTKGSADAPAGEVGKATTAQRPWSQTTVTSAIDPTKILKGEPISVVGEVIDMSCYLQVGKHGDKHRDCGQKCAKNGEPIGLVTSDGTIYTLCPEEHNPRRDGLTTLRDNLIEQMAYVIKVNGTLSTVDDQRVIYVQGFVKQ
jgi:hypothetical protein